MKRAAIALISFFVASTADAQEPTYLRLIDRLDRPQDGYCFDVLGSGGAFQVNMPLMAHNCKPGVAPDGVVLARDGTLFYPAFNACVTAMGVADTLLPNAALMLKPCGVRQAFLLADRFQGFHLTSEGMLQVRGFDLCVTVGGTSDHTFSSSHAWRTLFVTECADAEPRLSRWEFVTAPVQ